LRIRTDRALEHLITKPPAWPMDRETKGQQLSLLRQTIWAAFILAKYENFDLFPKNIFQQFVCLFGCQ